MIPLNNQFNQNSDKYLLTVSFPEISSERILHNLKQGSEIRSSALVVAVCTNLEAAGGSQAAAATIIDHGRKAKHKSKERH